MTGGGSVCLGVANPECTTAADVAIGNLARSRADFIGPATVWRGDCPESLDEAVWDATPCWHVSLPMRDGAEYTVVMGRYEDGHIGQIGGDAISGQFLTDR